MRKFLRLLFLFASMSLYAGMDQHTLTDAEKEVIVPAEVAGKDIVHLGFKSGIEKTVLTVVSSNYQWQRGKRSSAPNIEIAIFENNIAVDNAVCKITLVRKTQGGGSFYISPSSSKKLLREEKTRSFWGVIINKYVFTWIYWGAPCPYTHSLREGKVHLRDEGVKQKGEEWIHYCMGEDFKNLCDESLRGTKIPPDKIPTLKSPLPPDVEHKILRHLSARDIPSDSPVEIAGGYVVKKHENYGFYIYEKTDRLHILGFNDKRIFMALEYAKGKTDVRFGVASGMTAVSADHYSPSLLVDFSVANMPPVRITNRDFNDTTPLLHMEELKK